LDLDIEVFNMNYYLNYLNYYLD